ncbi:MAG: hypothetical protein NTX72_03455 [Candidatus Uhrbacteria bacterium]|nr:hypothetical protein [Candidatus Uhrbacteria bacterium]
MPNRAEDVRLIRLLREANVLVNVDGHKLHAPNGVIPVVCPDCDQVDDIDNHIRKLLDESGGRIRPHMLKQHGGGMLISEACPLDREFNIDRYLLKHIGIARNLKDINTIILYVHAPCGAAQLEGLNVVEILYHVVEAKKRVKAMWPTDRISCYIHVDYANEKKRTYFLSREAFERWFHDNNGEQYVKHMNKGNGSSPDHKTEFEPAAPASS